MSIELTNSQFLRELAGGASRGSVLWTTAFYGNPDGNTGWGGGPWEGGDRDARVDSYGDRNAYFSTAAFKPRDGELLRRLSCFDRLLAVVVDDPAITELNGTPSWVLQTSPGKYQVGLFLDGDDDQCADLARVTALVTALHRKGLIGGDKSGNNAVRYVRMPFGQNQKPRESGPWQCQLEQWNPKARYTLGDAAAILGIDIDAVVAEAPASHGTGAFAGEQDEKLAAAVSDIVYGQNLHDATNVVAASLVASGAHPGAVVNQVRALMHASAAPRDARWQARFQDIPRSVQSAVQKFTRPSTDNGGIDAQTGEVIKEPLFLWAGAGIHDLKPIEFLVDGYLETNSLSMLYGPSGCGKSFLSLDIGACVATGTAWHNQPTRQGAVFVVIGEGHNGYMRRVAAWGKQYNRMDELSRAPLFVSRHKVNLSDPGAGKDLSDEIATMVADSGHEPALIVIDTLARNFAGDENSAKDVGAFIDNCDQFLRRRYGAHVMIIHHTGNNTSERARGSSALKAALDQEFQAVGFDGRTKLACTKMKDAPTPPERRFKIMDVDLGQDVNGTPVSGGCAVLDGNPWDIEVGTIAGTKEKLTAYAVIREWTQGGIDNIADFVMRFGVAQGSASRVITKLAAAGILVKSGRWWDLSEKTWAEARAMCWVQGEAPEASQ